MIDLGTGDGRFVSAAAKAHPDKFFIGVDPNVKPLEKPSMKATRKPSKGGLMNAMFVQASVENLPDEFDCVADEIHIHFPWGSLLGGVLRGDPATLAAIRRIAAPDCLLEIVTGIDRERDRSEIERLGIPEISDEYLIGKLLPRFEKAGFRPVEIRRLERSDWMKVETSWARRLSSGTRRVVSLIFVAV